jgi:two-component system chemotaxis response regulator CheY
MVMCLIVDDDEISCEIAAKAIMSMGIDAVTRTDSRKALAFCAARMPDIILLDMMMSKMDGFEFIKRLRRLESGEDVKIIVSTGLHDLDSVQKLKSSGLAGYLVKPYSMDLLKQTFLRMGLLSS